jgi:hypothetical protein
MPDAMLKSVGFFSRRGYALSLESGMTLREWDALYGNAAVQRRIARFRLAAVTFGILFLSTIIFVAVNYGPKAPTRSVRLVVVATGMISLVGFTLSSVVLLMERILKFTDHRRLIGDKGSKRPRRRAKS